MKRDHYMRDVKVFDMSKANPRMKRTGLNVDMCLEE